MPSPIGKKVSVDPGLDSLLGPRDIRIPPAFGTVKERYQQDKDSKGLIVHIQDLHTHYEAHKNISSIIEQLSNRHGINMVLCEAKETDKGLAFLKPWALKKARTKVADQYLKEGKLTGWEALDLTSDVDLTLQGIEDKGLYMQDMDRFLKAEVFRPDALKFLKVLQNVIGNLKTRMYSRPQRAFDEKMGFYRDEHIGITEYTEYLVKLAGKHKIDHTSLANLKILLDTIALEKRINFKKAERERGDIIDVLAEKLEENDKKTLLDKAVEFQGNRISQNEFYRLILALINKISIDMKKYPDFVTYTNYLATYQDLDASKLFEEINSLENNLAEALFKKDNQKKLFKISKDISILRGLVDFKLTPDEFDYYAHTKAAFNTRDWLKFLKLNSEHYKLSQRVPDDASIIEDNIPILEDFYKIARKRDDAFVKNIDKQFNTRNLRAAFLATGGFHTPGVTRRLKEAGYSYVVIAPRIESDMDYDKYHKVLKDAYKSLMEEAVIGRWHLSDIGSDVTALINDLNIALAFRYAETEEEIAQISNRNRGLILLRDGTVLINPLLKERPNVLAQLLQKLITSPQALAEIRKAQEEREGPAKARTSTADADEYSAFMEQLENESPAKRREAAEALGRWGSTGVSAVPALTNIVRHDTDKAVVIAAIRTLGDIAIAEDAVPALLDRYGKGDMHIMAAVVNALGNIDPSAIPDESQTGIDLDLGDQPDGDSMKARVYREFVHGTDRAEAAAILRDAIVQEELNDVRRDQARIDAMNEVLMEIESPGMAGRTATTETLEDYDARIKALQAENEELGSRIAELEASAEELEGKKEPADLDARGQQSIRDDINETVRKQAYVMRQITALQNASRKLAGQLRKQRRAESGSDETPGTGRTSTAAVRVDTVLGRMQESMPRAQHTDENRALANQLSDFARAGHATPENRAVVTAVIESDTPPAAIRKMAVVALSQMIPDSAEVSSRLVDLIGNPRTRGTEVSLGAAEAFSLVDQNAAQAAVPRLIELTSDERWYVRAAAVRALGGMEDITEDMATAIVRVAGDESKRARVQAVRALPGTGRPASDLYPVLLESTKDEMVALRLVSIAALGELGPPTPEVYSTVDQIADKRYPDEPVKVINVAKSTLRKWDIEQAQKDGIPGLTKALDSKDEAVQRFAAVQLGRRGQEAKEAVPDLLNLARNTEGGDKWGVFFASLEALGDIGPPAADAAPYLRQLTQGYGPSSRTHQTSKRALAKIVPGAGRTATAELSPDRQREFAKIADSGIDFNPGVIDAAQAILDGIDEELKVELVIGETSEADDTYAPGITIIAEDAADDIISQVNSRDMGTYMFIITQPDGTRSTYGIRTWREVGNVYNNKETRFAFRLPGLTRRALRRERNSEQWKRTMELVQLREAKTETPTDIINVPGPVAPIDPSSTPLASSISIPRRRSPAEGPARTATVTELADRVTKDLENRQQLAADTAAPETGDTETVVRELIAHENVTGDMNLTVGVRQRLGDDPQALRLFNWEYVDVKYGERAPEYNRDMFRNATSGRLEPYVRMVLLRMLDLNPDVTSSGEEGQFVIITFSDPANVRALRRINLTDHTSSKGRLLLGIALDRVDGSTPREATARSDEAFLQIVEGLLDTDSEIPQWIDLAHRKAILARGKARTATISPVVSSAARTSTLGGGERLPVYDAERRAIHARTGTVSRTATVNGVVEIYALDLEGNVIDESGVLAGPGEQGTAREGTGVVEEAAAELSDAARAEIPRDRHKEQVTDITTIAGLGRQRADAVRADVVGFINEHMAKVNRNAGIRLSVDTLVGTSDADAAKAFIARHKVEVAEYLSFIAGNLLEWKKYAGDIIVFDFEASEGLVSGGVEKAIIDIWNDLATVKDRENNELLMLERIGGKKRYSDTQWTSIRDVTSTEAIENPLLAVAEAIPTADDTGMNWFDWELGLAGALLLAPAAVYAEEIGADGLSDSISEELQANSGVFNTFANMLSRLTQIQKSEITPEMLSFLASGYKDYSTDASGYFERLRSIHSAGLIWKVLKPVSFDVIRDIYKALGEVLRSI